MASATDFDTAAAYFDQVAGDLESWPTGLGAVFGDDTVSGGALSVACADVVRIAEATAVALAAAMAERAALCRQRAAQCRAHEAALADFTVAERAWRQRVAELARYPEPIIGDAPRPALPLRPVRPAPPPFMN